MTDELARVLLVDDDVAKRYVLGTWLRRAGHAVDEAGTGAEALAKVAAAEIVLLDVNLPDMTGFEVCRMIKTDPRTAAIPVIQVSATAVEVADRAHGLSQGADAYLIDPTEPLELLATVTAALRYYRARQRAELTAALLTTLTSVTLAINAAQTFDGLARAAAAGAARIFNAPAVLVLVQPDGQLRRTSASPGQPVPGQRGGPVELAERIAGRLLRPGEISAAAPLDRDDWLALMPDSTIRADVSLAVARTKPDRPPVGLVVVATGVPGAEEAQIQLQFVQSVALAVEALRSYAEEHLVAMTLQRSFLPAALPTLPGLAMSVRYIPASDQAEIGGDFYEALVREDKVLVAIGDVQGHSLHAATVMGELRHALRAFATEDHAPVALTGLVNEVLQRYHPGIIATLCIAVLDPATGELELVNCGHIPPLLVAGGTARYVGQGGLMLGLPFHEPHSERVLLEPGGTMLMVTDGLVEERTVFLDDNLEKLRAAAVLANDDEIEAFTNQLMSQFGPREDDVAMIALRRLA
jgi:serine phosphatase RsbU (regulator of sigma subunit)/DNA-binding NarL/FixJ family response regulator